MNAELQDIAVFKAWAKQNPDARRLLKEVIFRWRGSSARLAGDAAPWAAYPLATWRGWTGFTRSTLDRRLKDLVDAGLVERERHRFAGTIICPWLRPTELALAYSGAPADLARLKAKKTKPLKPTDEATVEATPEAAFEATPEATDYTSLPSSATFATKPTAPANKFTGEKGKAGEDDEVLAKKMVEAELKKQYGECVFDPDDPDIQMIVASKAQKLEKLLKKYPRIKGKHEAHVKHPYDLNPKWASFSPELQAGRYAVYKEYVDNWYSGNGGKPNKIWKEWTAEDDEELGKTLAAMTTDDDY